MKRLIIFDLDDTLIRSDARIRVFDSSSNEILASLTPSQFNYHVPGQSQYFSFDDFECEKILGRSRLFPNTFRSLKRYYQRGIPISIITARSNEKIVIDFFNRKNIRLRPSLVYGIHNQKYPFTGSVAERKKQAVEDLIRKGYTVFTYYDDNFDNLRAVAELSSDTVKIKTVHVHNE